MAIALPRGVPYGAPMATVIRRFAETPATPWRNGLGRMWTLVDDEHPSPLAADHPWRLSLAHLAGPSPFSAFPGIHRTLVPWGSDIRLEIDGELSDVHHGEAVRFSGDAITRLVALDRPCHAVNLMASDNGPTLVAVEAGAEFAEAAIALVTEPSAVAARFDVIALAPGKPLPSTAVVVRVGGDGRDGD